VVAIVTKRKNDAVGAALIRAYKDESACPVATVDVTLNIKNRNIAIRERGYGPMNPSKPNTDFWKGIADLWGISVNDAKSSRCGNCAAFIQTPKMLACIQNNLGLEEDYEAKADDEQRENQARTLEAGNLGYCQLFAFKCASERTCRAWLHGGPIK
jgi:hypothetical protein